jgi:hypothetical protein
VLDAPEVSALTAVINAADVVARRAHHGFYRLRELMNVECS